MLAWLKGQVPEKVEERDLEIETEEEVLVEDEVITVDESPVADQVDKADPDMDVVESDVLSWLTGAVVSLEDDDLPETDTTESEVLAWLGEPVPEQLDEVLPEIDVTEPDALPQVDESEIDQEEDILAEIDPTEADVLAWLESPADINIDVEQMDIPEELTEAAAEIVEDDTQEIGDALDIPEVAIEEEPGEDVDSIEVESDDSVEVDDIEDDDIYDPPTWVVRGEAPSEEEYDWKPPAVLEEMRAAADQDELLDINVASLAELERIPGMGFFAAQSIVAFRDEHGSIRSFEDLAGLPGLDESTIRNLRSSVQIDTEQTEVIEIPRDLDMPVETSTEDMELPSVQESPVPELTEDEIVDAGLEMVHQAVKDEPDVSAIEEFEFPDLDLPDDVAKIYKSFQEDWNEESDRTLKNMISSGENLDSIISILKIMTTKEPGDINLLQDLGDAYIREDRLTDAIDMYKQALGRLG